MWHVFSKHFQRAMIALMAQNDIMRVVNALGMSADELRSFV